MPTVQPFRAGGYRFISHQFQYSGGVPPAGFRIERARFARSCRWPTVLMPSKPTSPVSDARRAFCACELRSRRNSPTRASSLSIGICRAAGRLGDLPRGGLPVPLERVPGNQPAHHAVVLRLQLYGAERKPRARSFVAAGSGEAREGGSGYEGRIIRPGDH